MDWDKRIEGGLTKDKNGLNDDNLRQHLRVSNLEKEVDEMKIMKRKFQK